MCPSIILPVDISRVIRYGDGDGALRRGVGEGDRSIV